MRLRPRDPALLFVLAASLLPANAGATVQHRERVIVAGSARAAEAIRAHGGRVIDRQAGSGLTIAEAPGEGRRWARALAQDPSIRFAEPDQVVAATDRTPNDPSWSAQDNMKAVSAPKAWDSTTGSPEVVVGVIDTGVDHRHADLAANMWRNPTERADGVDNDRNGFVDDVHGADCRNRDGDPSDDNDHGTHVAGIVGAVGNNAVGVAGVNWNVRIMALKFLGPTSTGSLSDAIRCIDYAIAKGARILNASWGISAYSQALEEAIARARAAGVLFVGSAGNDALDTDSTHPHYPSSYGLDNVLSVAATNSTDGLASFSNWGPMNVDLAAPGFGIQSTLRGGRYGSKTGTSMSAPHVSGAAALVLAAHPSATYRTIAQRLLGGVDRVPGLAGKVASGGRLNVARAVETDARAPAAPIISMRSTSVTRSSISLLWSAPDEDGSVSGAPASYELRYRPAGAGLWARARAPAPTVPGALETATIGGLRPATSYDLSLVAIDNVGNRSPESTIRVSTAAGRMIASNDFATASWTLTGAWGLDDEQAHSPSAALADSPRAEYAASSDSWARAPAFSLAGAAEPILSFWHRHEIERVRDAGIVEISTDGGRTWQSIASVTGGSDWAPATIDLSAYAGAPNVTMRFRLRTDATTSHTGWSVDDVVVSASA